MVEFRDGVVAPTARAWLSQDKTSPSYSEAEGLLYFFDKYTTIMGGGTKEMSQFYKNNKGKTLLDKVSISDIAYSILVYESSYDVWMEDITMSQTCATKEEKKEFEHVAQNKYHVQRGSCLPMYRDGWTSDGRTYFDTICGEIRKMMRCDGLWSTLISHWETYSKKYHKYSYVLKEVDTNIGEDVAELEDDDDDNCVVFLPGDDDDDDDNNGDDVQGREKRQRQMWAV